ncbi:MAG TPA: PAS domain S-box protein, partial [Actinomycetota bacterium]
MAIWTVDRDLRFTMSEGRGLTALGSEPGENVGSTLFEHFGTHDPAFLPIASHRKALDGESTTYELTWMGRAFQTSVEPLRDGAGEIVGAIAIAFDISDRARVDTAIRRSEEHFRAFAESARDLIIRYRLLPSRGFEYVSPSAVELTGYTPAEFYADPDLGLKAIHPDDRSSYGAIASSPGSLAGPHVLRWVRKDGQVMWAEHHNAPIRDEDGRITAVQAIARDVTERERAEEDLRRRDAILGALTFAAERLLVSPSWQECMKNVLARLGHAARMSRAYVYENFTAPDGVLQASRRFEWTSEGGAPQLGNLVPPDLAWEEERFARWKGVLRRDGVIAGRVSQLPEPERAALAAEDILSILVVPVFVGEKWWGFLGFNQCDQERDFSRAEIDAFRAAAGTLGAAIQRRRAEEML